MKEFERKRLWDCSRYKLFMV